MMLVLMNIDVIEAIKIAGPTITSIIVAIIFIFYQKKQLAAEITRNNALADVCFLYEASHKVFKQENKTIIELEVKISNKSSRKLGILAIFVKYKPAIINKKELSHSYLDFNSLPTFESGDLEDNCSLTKLKNIAFVPNFFWQTSVDGISIRKGFDIVDNQFCEKYPLLITQIIIFGSSVKLIDKTHIPKYHVAPLRTDWVNYVAETNKENYIFFGRAKAEGVHYMDFHLNEQERVLIKKDESIDLPNTMKFNELLQSVINSNIEKVVDLRTETELR
ncbi:MAG: hypothetical protein JST10_02785 [Bacteroidetes bacterium]|nr:hypothetical protein [Bacteroidota bacterium]